MFKKFLIFRSGFLQDKGSPGNGIVGMFHEAARKYGGHPNRVEMESWKEDPQATAEFIYRLSGGQSGDSPEVMFVGYSWGCGYAFPRLARELGYRGIRVSRAVMIDPVHYAWGRWWRAFLHRTFLRSFEIEIPDNVDTVTWFRQKVSWPRSPELKVLSPETKLIGPVMVQAPHIDIDNHPTIHRQVARLVGEFFGGEE